MFVKKIIDGQLQGNLFSNSVMPLRTPKSGPTTKVVFQTQRSANQ